MRRRHCNTLPAASTFKPEIVISPLVDSALVRPRAGLKGQAATAQMAEDMRQGGHREGGVTEHDLKLLGCLASKFATSLTPQTFARSPSPARRPEP